MMKRRITITEKELIDIIQKSAEKVFEQCRKPKTVMVPVEEKYMGNRLSEGLIVSYPSDKVISYMAKTFSLDKDIDSYLNNPQDKNGAIVLTSGNNSTEIILVSVRKDNLNFSQEVVNTMQNLCGWQLSCVVNSTPMSKFYPGWFIDRHYVFQFEKKLSNDATTDVFGHQYIYHICPASKLERINHIGLIPRDSTWPDFAHKGRIYFYLDKPNLKNISKDFSRKKVITDGYCLLRIDLTKIPDTTTFFYDPRQRGAVITTDNIPAKAIENITES